MDRLMSACPACEQPNAATARFCSACGCPLVTRCSSCLTINARTRSVCHHCAAPLSLPAAEPKRDTASDALPVLDAGPDSLPTIPDGDLSLTLRVEAIDQPGGRLFNLPELDLADAIAEAVADADAPAPSPFPAIFDPLDDGANAAPAAPARRPVPAPVPSAPAATVRPALDPTALGVAALTAEAAAEPIPAAVPAPKVARSGMAEKKAERRASVRRARLRAQRKSAEAAAAAGATSDVLVLEPVHDARESLAKVLAMFGFGVHAVATVREAQALAADGQHVAAFLGLGPQDAQVAVFCSQLRAAARPSNRPLAVIALVDAGRHADRVRMELAGADKVLFRPVNRGHVARALEDFGVWLPKDPRAASRSARRAAKEAAEPSSTA